MGDGGKKSAFEMEKKKARGEEKEIATQGAKKA